MYILSRRVDPSDRARSRGTNIHINLSPYASPGSMVSASAPCSSHAPPVLPVRCETQSASLVSSSSEAWMRSRSQSLISRPSTISYEPSPVERQGMEKTMPSAMPYGFPSVHTALLNQSPSFVGVTSCP